MNNFCGLDFGTSNSSMGYAKNSIIKLTEFNNKPYIPSSIFFEFDEPLPFFGEEAKKRYIDGREGRMIWSPKNALGTSLIHEKTQVQDKSVSFKDIISLIIKNIKNQCESEAGQNFKNIVVGRPVFYNDKDPKLDQDAEDAMRDILKAIGFEQIIFEYEPIAAAAHYEQSITNEQIALIVDMGGGTSDFTVAKLNKNSSAQQSKILAIGGVHIAGTNFDKSLNLRSMMPELGLGSLYQSLEGKWAPLPPTIHNDLATWHKIGFCYNKKNLHYAKGKIYSSNEPHKLERLWQTLEFRLGHSLAMAIEQAKIELSGQEQSFININNMEPAIDLTITAEDLKEAITNDVENILTAMKSTIANAQVPKSSIDAIFMTGGASMVPLVRNKILAYVPQAKLVDGDKFGSVAAGLTLLASMRFSSL